MLPQDININDPTCVAQAPLHNCNILKPFVNFFKLQQTQPEVTEEWKMDLNKRYIKMQTKREREDTLRNFKPTAMFDIVPLSTRCERYRENIRQISNRPGYTKTQFMSLNQ